MLNAIVAIELTGVVLGAFDVFVDTDFYTETFFKSFHQFVERFVLEVVDAVFPQLGFEGADYRLLELAVFELCPVSWFEHRAFFARRYFYRTLEVAHNRWKPFIVNTPNGKVKVLGTKFYVTSTLKEKDFMVSPDDIFTEPDRKSVV